MLFDDDIPPTSGDEAYARRMRPPPERYDPDNLSHWSITMTVAWIIWGEIDAVRSEWDNYREDCADWVFESDPVARAQVEKIKIDNTSTGQTAPNDPSLDFRLQQGSWRFSQWNPSGWDRLCLTALSEDIPPEVAIDSLWLAGGEGRIQATALECENAETFRGNLIEIPRHYWARLNRTEEPSGKAMLSGLGRVFRDVQFPRLDVKNVWPKSSGPREVEPSVSAEKDKGGRPSEYDWDAVKAYALGLVQQHGMPGRDNRRLPTKSQLVEAVLNEWSQKYDQQLAESSVRRYVNKWLNDL